jgi:hypothetical protein
MVCPSKRMSVTLASVLRQPMTENRETVDDVAGVLRRRWKRTAAIIAVAILLLGGAFMGGYFVADDKTTVDELTEQLSDTQDDLSATESDLEDSERDAATLEGDLEETQKRLDAELNLSGKRTSTTSSDGASVLGDLKIGQAGEVGAFTMKPTTFERAENVSDGYETTSPDEGTTFYVARITVKNDGQEPASPFCAGGGQLLDDSDRRYDAEALLASDTANCDDVQPGAQKDNFEIYFQVPLDAKPQTMILFGDDFSDDGDGTAWDVR